jgi:SAM-dependent methyltransferase
MMKKKIASVLSQQMKKSLFILKSFIESFCYAGKGRYCPICGKTSRKFQKFGIKPREDACCLNCGALERHRFVWLYFSRMTNLFDCQKPKRMLHIAPERCFESRLRNIFGAGYITADLLDPRAMIKMDITDIHYPNEFFDIIYCSHVLEHVQDDRLALKELHRVLKQDGWAVLIVPIGAELTIENPNIIDPNKRLELFGKEDHVRLYGHDYIDRLNEAGFNVKVSFITDLFEKNDIILMGLTPASGEIYYCTKN